MTTVESSVEPAGSGGRSADFESTSRYVEVPGTRLHYHDAGDGTPLVLLHGGGSRAQTFEEMVPILAKSFQVYTFDMRGFGTEMDRDVMSHGVREVVARLAA